MIHYEIWQAPPSCPYKFYHYDWIKGQKPNVRDYVMVYRDDFITFDKTIREKKFDTEQTLEYIFEMLNVDQPLDYHAASLSVSDVICLIDDNKRSWWYVDGVGFVELKDWEVSN